MSLPVSDLSEKREPLSDRKVWVDAKALAIHDALVAEFRKDADRFDIRRPKTKLWTTRLLTNPFTVVRGVQLLLGSHHRRFQRCDSFRSSPLIGALALHC